MKKIVVCLLAIFLGISLTGNAQSAYEKQRQKQMKKEYKQKVKEFSKGGWQVYGSSHTLEMELLDHYVALEKEGVSEVSGFATTSSPNIAQGELSASASRAYAQMSSGTIRESLTGDMGSNISEDQLKEFEHFYDAYEQKVEAEIKGKLKPSYTIRRQTAVGGKKTYEWIRCYILDEESAHRACLRALEQAAKETALAEMTAEQIHEYLEKSFRNE